MESTSSDKEEIRKYLPGMQRFLEHSMSAEDFVRQFLITRRHDSYLMSGQFSLDVEQILSSLFSAADRHAPPELYTNENGYINDEELREIVEEIYLSLTQL